MTEQKQSPEISVIVPVYKVEKYLNECIDSILQQTFADFELILVDDGSPDNCPALCDAAAAKDSRVRVIHKPNGGVSTARNAGLDAAKGSWIAFVDSDDTVHPEYLARMAAAAAKTGADMVLCGCQDTDADGTPVPRKEGLVFEEELSHQEVMSRCILSAYQVVWNKLYRRELFNGLRYPEGKAFEDTWFLPRLYCRVQKMAAAEQMLYYYRLVPGSAMHRKITLKTLDRVEACYQMFLAMYEQEADTLCLAYRTVLTGLVDIWLHLPPAERKSSRMKECIGYERDAWHKLRQAHGITPRTVWDTLVYTVSPPRYLASRRRRLAKKAAAVK